MKIQFDNGKIAEFDGTPTDDDIEEAYQASGGKQAKPSIPKQSLADLGREADTNVQTGDEAIRAGLSGFIAPLAAAPVAVLKTLNDKASGRDSDFEQNYNDAQSAISYVPKTPGGIEAAQRIADFSNRNLAPLLGHMGNLHVESFPERAPKPTKGANPEGALADLNGRADRPDINLNEGPGTGTQPLYADQRGVVTPELPDESLQAAKAAQQGAEEVSTGPGRETIPPSAGEEPIYVDPQGQAFRGTPAEDDARLGLEKQTEATDVALDHPEQLTKSLTNEEPLELLHKDNLDAANEGPQFPSMEEGMQSQFKQTLLDKAIEDHPLMKAAQDRITKQEELVTKLSGQVEDGKAQPAMLARAMKDLENFEASAERLKQNLTDNIPGERPTVPFNFKKQGGAINPEVFKEGFEKLKQLADGTWLRATGDGRGLTIEAIRDSKNLGVVDFIKPRDATDNLKSAMTSVTKDARGKGYATEMYRFASELGNDISPSDVLSSAGEGMWKGFQQKGLAPDGTIKSPGNKQRGALLIDPKDEGKGKFLENNPALKLPTIVPDKLTADKVIEMGKTMKDVDQNALQKIANYFTKGGLYQALKTDNPIIKFGVEKITEADRLARGDIQDYVHDRLGPVTRALSDKEKAEIWLVASEADRLKKPLDLDSLAKNGYSTKQLKWAETHREVMNKAFDAINQARKSAGLEPIERRVAYAAMKASGDYRRLVYKADDVGQKNVVGIVGADTRRTLDQRMDALIQKGYTNFGEEQYFGGVPRDRGSAQQAMTHAIEILAENDPRIKEFLDVVDSINKNEAYSFLNAKKHTMDKKGVFGMEGRKLYNTALDNAKEGMQAQLSYAESALKWGRLSEAIEAIRPVLASKDLNMPKAKEWTEGYVKNALGYNPSELGHHLEMAFAKGMQPTGIGFSNVRSAVAVSRKLINTMLLGLNPGFWFTNVVQPMKAMPGMKAYLVAKGLDANFDFGTGWSYIAKAGLTEWKSKYGKLNAIEKGAYDYALSHHVYGSEMVEHSNKATKDFSYYTDKAGGVLSGPIEASTRRMMYLSFVDMLHQNGLSVKNGLYEAAHNLTDMTMNNYSPTERPKMYNSMGPLGDMAVNLSSYKHNELSRTALFARQLAQEKTAKPLLTELAAGLAFAGLTGTIAFDEADQVYKAVSGLAGHPDSLSLRAIKLSEHVGKLMGNSDKHFNNSDYLLSHGMFSMLGVDIAKRIGLNNVIPETVADAAFPGVSKLGSMAKATYQAAAPDFMPGSNGGPSKMNTLRAVREDSPNIVASNMDLDAFSKGNLGNNPNNLKGQVVRTPTDVMAKRFGVQGIHESVEKAKTYETKYIEQKYEAARQGPLHNARDELYATGKVSNSTAQAYLKADGDIGSLTADLARFAKEQNMPAKDLAMLQAAMSQSVANLHHLQRMKAAYENK